MKIAAACLGNNIYRGAFAASVDGGEALRADNKLLNRFQRKLHYRSADGVVFVVDAVDRNVHVATARPVDCKHRNAALGRII